MLYHITIRNYITNSRNYFIEFTTLWDTYN